MAGESSHAWVPDARNLKTVRDWVRLFVTEMNKGGVFFGHGSTNALDEAIYMVQSALHLPIETMEPFWDARLTEAEHHLLANWLRQRIHDRKPASYITGESWLQGQRFVVDSRVIIPRSFIAELLTDQLTPWVQNPDEIGTVLDMCTGSGCLAILAAQAFEFSEVVGVDLSTDALAIARKNIELHQLNDQVSVVQSDLYDSLDGRQFDLIISNPPYVNESSMKALPPEYLHEPRMALAGGETGMDLIDRILRQAPDHLTEQGMLVLELGNERPYFEEAYPNLPVTWLSVSAGEEQVFMISRDELIEGFQE